VRSSRRIYFGRIDCARLVGKARLANAYGSDAVEIPKQRMFPAKVFVAALAALEAVRVRAHDSARIT
jgi:hypothetical protein